MPDNASPSASTIRRRNPPLRRATLIVLFLAVTCLPLLLYYRTGLWSSPPYIREFPIMGTFGNLTFWAPRAIAEKTADAVVKRLEELQETINLFDETSELARLNRTAFEKPFVCSPELWQILQAARQANRETRGVFDISIGPLMKLWGFHHKRSSMPAPEEIEAVRQTVGLDQILFDDAARTVRFRHPESYLDFGGIAKGYALDLVAPLVQQAGISRGTIDLGGNILCLPDPPPGKAEYAIGVRDPEHPDSLITAIPIKNLAIATSGSYEQQVRLGGKQVTHIMDPRSGQPVEGVLGVTVVTPKGVDSDIFSTAIFVAGAELAREFVKTHPGSSVLLVKNGPDNQPVTERFNWNW